MADLPSLMYKPVSNKWFIVFKDSPEPRNQKPFEAASPRGSFASSTAPTSFQKFLLHLEPTFNMISAALDLSESVFFLCLFRAA
jgi:hypothetical protein